MPSYKYSDLTGLIIGCAMKVHRYFGPGFPEIIYLRSLVIELTELGMDCKCQLNKEVYYRDRLVGLRRLDLLVNDVIIVETKAVTEVEPLFINQITNYLRVFKMEVGLLLNFGNVSLQFKRFAN